LRLENIELRLASLFFSAYFAVVGAVFGCSAGSVVFLGSALSSVVGFVSLPAGLKIEEADDEGFKPPLSGLLSPKMLPPDCPKILPAVAVGLVLSFASFF
jgi:hypothetical protein